MWMVEPYCQIRNEARFSPTAWTGQTRQIDCSSTHILPFRVENPLQLADFLCREHRPWLPAVGSWQCQGQTSVLTVVISWRRRGRELDRNHKSWVKFSEHTSWHKQNRYLSVRIMDGIIVQSPIGMLGLRLVRRCAMVQCSNQLIGIHDWSGYLP